MLLFDPFKKKGVAAESQAGTESVKDAENRSGFSAEILSSETQTTELPQPERVGRETPNTEEDVDIVREQLKAETTAQTEERKIADDTEPYLRLIATQGKGNEAAGLTALIHDKNNLKMKRGDEGVNKMSPKALVDGLMRENDDEERLAA